MELHPYLCWLTWNPERTVFTVPGINHPVVWYGIWFALGFIIGYLILIPMVRRRLQHTQQLMPRDVMNWTLLVQATQAALEDRSSLFYPHVQKLDKKSQLALSKADVDATPSEEVQSAIVYCCNLAMNNPQSGITRASLIAMFPKTIYTYQQLAALYVDRMTWLIVAGTIIGARLGHVFFYEWPRYQNNLGEIYKVWKGGLASHGATLGILIALFVYQYLMRKKFPEINFITLLDMIVVPTAFAACCIRIGNFFNQEILGTPSSLPWAVIFGDPADGSAPLPRHPVQLYEGIVYLGTFFILYYLWKYKGSSLRPGFLSGLFFILVFGSRFFLEFLKMPQSVMIDESYLQTGQYLSIPIVIGGIMLLFYNKWSNCKIFCSSK